MLVITGATTAVTRHVGTVEAAAADNTKTERKRSTKDINESFQRQKRILELEAFQRQEAEREEARQEKKRVRKEAERLEREVAEMQELVRVKEERERAYQEKLRLQQVSERLDREVTEARALVRKNEEREQADRETLRLQNESEQLQRKAIEAKTVVRNKEEREKDHEENQLQQQEKTANRSKMHAVKATECSGVTQTHVQGHENGSLCCARCSALNIACDHEYPCGGCLTAGAECELACCGINNEMCSGYSCRRLHPDQYHRIVVKISGQPLFYRDEFFGDTLTDLPKPGSALPFDAVKNPEGYEGHGPGWIFEKFRLE